MIHNSIDFLGLVFNYLSLQANYIYGCICPEHIQAFFCTCSAFPSSKIPNKTLCSVSNCCFSFPFFSSRSSSLNDLNVLGIFSQDFLQQFICCKRSSILISFFLWTRVININFSSLTAVCICDGCFCNRQIVILWRFVDVWNWTRGGIH